MAHAFAGRSGAGLVPQFGAPFAQGIGALQGRQRDAFAAEEDRRAQQDQLNLQDRLAALAQGLQPPPVAPQSPIDLPSGQGLLANLLQSLRPEAPTGPANADVTTLSQINAPAAQAVIQARQDPSLAPELRTSAQTALDFAAETQKLDVGARRKAITEEVQRRIISGEPFDRLLEIGNARSDDLMNLGLRKMQVSSQEVLNLVPAPAPTLSRADAQIQLATRFPKRAATIRARQDRAAASARSAAAARGPQGPLAEGLAEIALNEQRGFITPEDATARRAKLRSETTVGPAPAFSGEVPDGFMLADPSKPRLGVIPIPGVPDAAAAAEGFAIQTEILASGATIQGTSTGDVIVKDPEGNVVEGQARLDVLEQSRETEGDLARTIAGEKEAGKVAIQVSREAFDTLGIVNRNIENLQQVVTLLDEGGKITGPIRQRLPNLSANAVELENLRSKLALDVVGATRFGALSKGELDLAKDVALPTGLRPEELSAHVEARIAAQQKYGQYLSEAATFLGIPGNTVSDWIIAQDAAQKTREDATQTTGPVATPTAAQISGMAIEDVRLITEADISNMSQEAVLVIIDRLTREGE